mmetsp:Transcript_102095/g.284249  ORF Transcript_102095/g.284249 Transcript_102095/m.284249 type:complete len:320 (-) Transcript_102095:25-984(-)
MVRPIMDVPGLIAKCTADQREAVGPLTASAIPCLQQLAGVVVPREAGLVAAHVAVCHLYVARTELLLGRRRGCGANCLGVRGAAVLTSGAVRPGEEIVLEPAEYLPHEGHLIAFGLGGSACGRIDAAHGDVIERLPLERAVLVSPHMVQVANLVLQPLGSAAQLRLEHRQVLLFHEPCRAGRRRGLLHLEGIISREVAKHDDDRRPVRVVSRQQHVRAQRKLPVLGGGLNAHKPRSHGPREEHAHGRLQEAAAAVELAAAVHGAPGALASLRAGDLELRDPLRTVRSWRYGHTSEPTRPAQVHLVPRRGVLLVCTPPLR